MKKYLLLILVFSNLMFAEQIISGLVVSIADGDTIGIVNNKKYYKIRLSEIDAPEKKQNFGQVSKRNLSNICYNKIAVVKIQSQDKYDRFIGNVQCNNINANLYQVSNGLAWVYKHYSNNPSLLKAELSARQRGLGLWIENNPIAPWDFRHIKK